MTNLNIKLWIMAARPKTLWAAISPVIIGTAVAYNEGLVHYLTFAVTLLSAVFIQIGTNLANDYYDFVKGSDTDERKGPTRVTQAGLIPPNKVKSAFIIVFVIAFLFGLYLIFRGGYPILIIGLSSILFGVLYTGGPYPLGYNGLGDIFVLIFFGPVAVGGTYYLQTMQISNEVMIIGLIPGLISTALLAVNNLRDIETDTKSGKRTLGVRFGQSFVRFEFLFCIVFPTLIPGIMYIIYDYPQYIVFNVLVLIIAIPQIKLVFNSNTAAEQLNGVLGFTGKYLLINSIVFSILWII